MNANMNTRDQILRMSRLIMSVNEGMVSISWFTGIICFLIPIIKMLLLPEVLYLGPGIREYL